MPCCRLSMKAFWWAAITGIRALMVCGIFASTHSVYGQTNENSGAVTTQDQPPFRLRIGSDLVVVRVVVRDSQGKPVEGLQKEDFKLFDRGKEHSIAQFEAGTSAPETTNSSSTVIPGQTITASKQILATPQRFLALYFDDLNMLDTDVIDARDAAKRYLADLQPTERVAMFTSATMLSDFTADQKQIHEALSRLHAHPRVAGHTECPELSDYQALEIMQHENPRTSDAWIAALDEAMARCHMPRADEKALSDTHEPPAPSNAADVTVTMVRNLARMVVSQAEMDARTNLQELEKVVNVIARAPGQRNIILVSPGFLSQSEQYELNRIIDRALRSEIVISSLDPRGLALLMREADVTRGYIPSADSGAVGPQHNLDTLREMVASDVLAEVAEGTGGEFFHNNNDLAAGFRALAGAHGSYILAFVPTDAKPDGKFHALKVTLAEKHKGITLKARRGYYAAKKDIAEMRLPQPISAPAGTDAQVQEKIRQAVLSQVDIQELPVEIHTEVSKAADHRELVVTAHLDAKSLHFHKEGEWNQNTVTFVSAIFDQSGKYIIGQQRLAKVDLADDGLPNLLATGIDVKITFPLKPGSYTVRQIVTDSEEHRMTAVSRSVEVQ